MSRATTAAPTTARSSRRKGALARWKKDGGFLLQADLLAPVTAGLLFPDLLQRFIPFPVPCFDCARAFEASAEESVERGGWQGAQSVREAFWRHWRTDGPSPMLFLGTTIAENGQQVVIAPVNIRREKSYNVIDLKSLRESTGLAEELDVPLAPR